MEAAASALLLLGLSASLAAFASAAAPYDPPTVGGYRVGYDIELSGTVSPGTVTGLEGVRVRVLFVWVPITGVQVAGGEVTVHIGPIRKSFPAVGFKSSPQCTIGSAAADILLPSVEQ
ncbi:unnamed protein product [Miscanthus lutarioriparius]|uniref:MD-2-related lipid-recognition domain-containing protein n=1 Tax=Miscanthus lutarioriparius TaxID=422564 RepID=A0A811QNV7_9POAL|nr:unnamed protein product [Miscanthus lutarioriparius]